MKNKRSEQPKTLPGLQQNIFTVQLVLLMVLALVMAVAGTWLNLSTESKKRDQNLQNVAEVISRSQILTGESNIDSEMLAEYLNSLMEALSSIDVVSVIDVDNVRLYHSNSALIGTVYDGTMPNFEENKGDCYTEYSSGPSGNQRRAYAAIFDSDGRYRGFVLAVMLMTSIQTVTEHTILLYGAVTVFALGLSFLLSRELSKKIKSGLKGYEPDVFSAMYNIRDNILSVIDEGILAVNSSGQVQFANAAAAEMLGVSVEDVVGLPAEGLNCEAMLTDTLRAGEKIMSRQSRLSDGKELIIDSIPLQNAEGIVVGAVGILHDRTEYTKLMEELAGNCYLVESMRANNHDFTNKLHVILGLIQMQMYEQAEKYIENISMVQRETIGNIMNKVSDPSVAALLVGKSARAAELNVKFFITKDSGYSPTDLHLPSGALVTILGNLIDNAFDAMDKMDDGDIRRHELHMCIRSMPGSLMITVADNGPGIEEGVQGQIFEKGFSTKGTGHGTGLYQVKGLVEGLGGSITLKSKLGKGSCFTVCFGDAGGERG